MKDVRPSLSWLPKPVSRDISWFDVIHNIILAASALGAMRYDALAIPTLVIILKSWRLCRLQYGIKSTTKLIGCPVMIGLGLGQWLGSADLSKTTFGSSLFLAAATCSVVLMSIVLVDLSRSVWQHGDETIITIIANVLLLPTSWTFACIGSTYLNHGSTFGVSSYTSLFPVCLTQNASVHFLDALTAQESIRAFSIWQSMSRRDLPTKTYSGLTDHRNERSLHRSFCKAKTAITATILISLLCISLGGFILPQYFLDEQLVIGCVLPHDSSDPRSMLKAIRDQIIDNVNIAVVPATSAYIRGEKQFKDFRKEIRNIIKPDQATVVLSTTDFQKKQSCEDDLFKQIYPIGEKRRFVHSYTKTSQHKLVNSSKVATQSTSLGSLFLTWQTKQHVKNKQGRLLVAAAICLDENFPDRIFEELDASPDLLIIPASAWSKAAPQNMKRWKALAEAAVHHKMRILSCGQRDTRFLDARGHTIIHRGSGSFAMNYNIAGIKWVNRIGHWWLLLPCGLISVDLVRWALLHIRKRPS